MGGKKDDKGAGAAENQEGYQAPEGWLNRKMSRQVGSDVGSHPIPGSQCSEKVKSRGQLQKQREV